MGTYRQPGERNLEKEKNLPKVSAIPGLYLSPNTAKPQKNIVVHLRRDPPSIKCHWVDWHNLVKNTIKSQRTSNCKVGRREALCEIVVVAKTILVGSNKHHLAGALRKREKI